MPAIETLTAAGVFDTVLKKLAANAIVGAGKSIIAAFANFERDFGDHLRQAFERCSKVRTILNRDESVDLLSLYVNLLFRSGAAHGIDDYTLIDLIRTKKRAVISGLGGGGKSMFMRYLWLTMFNFPHGKVPGFVELRRFNDLTTTDFATFLFRSIVDPSSKIAQPDFERALSEGRFALILDGFDEIKEDLRAVVELEVLRLSRMYPETIIVVSSRPEGRIAGWQSFTIFHVQPMVQQQVIDLIGKLTYEPKIKKKFIQRVKRDLYERHESFLSNPLLATMMMLTFDQFADIPEKTYLFYEQAFETLFAKHDALKEAYKRHSYTGLSIDIFKRVVAYFCLMTYYDQKYEFPDAQLLALLDKSIDVTEKSISADALLKDLTESVCLLQREGLNYVFVHRSFQEYFAAYCLSSLITNRMSELCPGIVGRSQDEVIPMCFDMNQETIEEEYIRPRLASINKDFSETKKGEDQFISYMKRFQAFVLVQGFEDENVGYMFIHSLSPDWSLTKALRRLYPQFYMAPNKPYLDEGKLIKQTFGLPAKHSLLLLSVDGITSKPDSKWLDNIGIDRWGKIASIAEIKKFNLYSNTVAEIDRLKLVSLDITSRAEQRSRSIESIFNLPRKRIQS